MRFFAIVSDFIYALFSKVLHILKLSGSGFNIQIHPIQPYTGWGSIVFNSVKL